MNIKLNTKSILAAVCAATLIGCAGRAEIWPNTDKALRRTSAEFAADAAKRFPYKADAPRGGEINGRAQAGYTLNRINVINLSEETWNNVEIWVNKSYVVFVPSMPPKKLKNIPFQAIYNADGQNFPLNNMKTLVNTVEIFRDGKMYEMPTQLAD